VRQFERDCVCVRVSERGRGGSVVCGPSVSRGPPCACVAITARHGRSAARHARMRASVRRATRACARQCGAPRAHARVSAARHVRMRASRHPTLPACLPLRRHCAAAAAGSRGRCRGARCRPRGLERCACSRPSTHLALARSLALPARPPACSPLCCVGATNQAVELLIAPDHTPAVTQTHSRSPWCHTQLRRPSGPSSGPTAQRPTYTEPWTGTPSPAGGEAGLGRGVAGGAGARARARACV
jgi:hypothetical protein